MNTDKSSETAAAKFEMHAADERLIPFTGAPVDELPEWGGVAQGDGFKFILHPPLDFEIAYRVPQYLIFSPYAHAAADLSVAEGSVYRRRWAAGAAFVVPPGTTVRARLAEPVEFLCLVVEPDHADRIFERVARGRPWAPAVIEDYVDPGFAALQLEVRRSLLGDPLMEPAYLEKLVDAILARLGCYLLGVFNGHSAKETLQPALVRRLVQHIESNLSSKLTVSGLAEMAKLSRSHFSRAFQAVTGEPPREFIIGRRLSRARELLADSERSVAEVATTTGFSSQAHLATAFKKRFGVTPSDYRAAFGRKDV